MAGGSLFGTAVLIINPRRDSFYSISIHTSFYALVNSLLVKQRNEPLLPGTGLAEAASSRKHRQRRRLVLTTERLKWTLRLKTPMSI